MTEAEVRDNIATLTNQVFNGVVLPKVKNRGYESFVMKTDGKLYAVSVEQLGHITLPTTTVENVSGSS